MKFQWTGRALRWVSHLHVDWVGARDGDRDDVQYGDKNGDQDGAQDGDDGGDNDQDGDQDDVQDGGDGGDHDHNFHGCSVLNEHWGASKDGEKMPTDHMLTFR